MSQPLKNVVPSTRRGSLDGWWMARAAALGGVPLPCEALPALAMIVFDPNLYLGSDVATIHIDRDRTPAMIDILITRGPNQWRFIAGILRQQGGGLQLCLDLSGAERPLTFESAPGSRVLLVTYERAPRPDAADKT